MWPAYLRATRTVVQQSACDAVLHAYKFGPSFSLTGIRRFLFLRLAEIDLQVLNLILEGLDIVRIDVIVLDMVSDHKHLVRDRNLLW